MGSELLKCLGKEELSYHKTKQLTPQKRLNKELISRFIQLNDRIKIKPALLDQICNRKNQHPSLELLKLLLLKKNSLFLASAPSLTEVEQSMDKNAIKELVKEAHYLFIDYLNILQANVTKPGCINKKLPEVDNFYYKTRYILEDSQIDHIFKDSIKINSIFKKLKNTNLLQGC